MYTINYLDLKMNPDGLWLVTSQLRLKFFSLRFEFRPRGIDFYLLRFSFKFIEIENDYFHRLVTNHNPYGFNLNLCNLE